MDQINQYSTDSVWSTGNESDLIVITDDDEVFALQGNKPIYLF